MGSAGRDILLETRSSDVALGGNDVIKAAMGNDTVCAGPGQQPVVGGH